MRLLLTIAASLTLWATASGAVPGRAQPQTSCTAPAVLSIDPQSPAYARMDEVQEDSLWLIRQVRARYPARLAAAFVDGPMEGAIPMPGRQPGNLRLVIRLTGDDPVPRMRLSNRARDVPVVVEYNAPRSLEQVDEIRRSTHHRLIALLPGIQGSGYDERTGIIHLDVYAPDEAARRKVLASCAEAVALLGMPVRMQINSKPLSSGPERLPR